MNKPTELQYNLLVKIAESDYTGFNGNVEALLEANDAYDTTTWAFSVIETAQDKGTFTSLLNADLVWHISDGKDSTVGLTEKGLVVLREFYKK
jgi:hypothetical protein